MVQRLKFLSDEIPGVFIILFLCSRQVIFKFGSKTIVWNICMKYGFLDSTSKDSDSRVLCQRIYSSVFHMVQRRGSMDQCLGRITLAHIISLYNQSLRKGCTPNLTPRVSPSPHFDLLPILGHKSLSSAPQ